MKGCDRLLSNWHRIVKLVLEKYIEHGKRYDDSQERKEDQDERAQGIGSLRCHKNYGSMGEKNIQ